MADEENIVPKEIRDEMQKNVEDMNGTTEAVEKAKEKLIKAICYIIGLVIGIKCYFLNEDNGFVIDLLATGVLMKIIEWVVFAIIGASKKI